MTVPAVYIKNVSFAYNALQALQDITLTVENGEFLGIVGPNAGGKSTLLKLILGVLLPKTGQIRILGRTPKAARQDIGYVPQYPAFSKDFPITVEQAVLMGRLGKGSYVGYYSRNDRIAVQKVLAEVEAADIGKRQINSLSGGQMQRMLLARALVSNPSLLILDEPTANIDQRVEGEIFDLLRELNRRMTIVVVSHDIAFISSYINRVACLNRTLLYHHTTPIHNGVIAALYGGQVQEVTHKQCGSTVPVSKISCNWDNSL